MVDFHPGFSKHCIWNPQQDLEISSAGWNKQFVLNISTQEFPLSLSLIKWKYPESASPVLKICQFLWWFIYLYWLLRDEERLLLIDCFSEPVTNLRRWWWDGRRSKPFPDQTRPATQLSVPPLTSDHQHREEEEANNSFCKKSTAHQPSHWGRRGYKKLVQ